MDARTYPAVVRRHLPLVLGVIALSLLSAFLLTRAQQPSYTSTGRLLVTQSDSIFLTTERVRDADFVQTEIQFLESEGVRNLVREQLGSVPKVDAAQVGTTSVIEVQATGSTARQAKATTDAYMEAYLTFRREAAAEDLANTARQVQVAVDDLQRQIDALSNQLRTVSCPPTGGCADRTAIEQDRDARTQEQVPLRQKLSQLSIDASAASVGMVVAPGSRPSDPTNPKPVRNAVLALILGSLLGVGLAISFDALDDSVRDVGDIEMATRDVPVLALIPSNGADKSHPNSGVVTMSAPTSPTAEAYRSLRTSLRFVSVDRPLRSLQVTSATSAEGKTATVANLGVVLAGVGELVVMVNCDLRRPRLHEYFGVPNKVGLTSVLLGEASLSEALQRVSGDRRLWLLSAGPQPPNPSDLLSSTRTEDVLEKLQSLASIVVIDSPPVLTVSDAAILSGKVDGTVLVTRTGVSSRKKVTQAVSFLHQIGAPLLGTVVHTDASGHAAEDGYWAPRSHLPSRRRIVRAHPEELPIEGAHSDGNGRGSELPLPIDSPGTPGAARGGPDGDPSAQVSSSRRKDGEA